MRCLGPSSEEAARRMDEGKQTSGTWRFELVLVRVMRLGEGVVVHC